MLTPEDIKEIASKGISEETFEEQLNRFKTGFPYLKIKAVATVGNGIMRLMEKKSRAASRLGTNSLPMAELWRSLYLHRVLQAVCSRTFLNLYRQA